MRNAGNILVEAVDVIERTETLDASSLYYNRFANRESPSSSFFGFFPKDAIFEGIKKLGITHTPVVTNITIKKTRRTATPKYRANSGSGVACAELYGSWRGGCWVTRRFISWFLLISFIFLFESSYIGWVARWVFAWVTRRVIGRSWSWIQ